MNAETIKTGLAALGMLFVCERLQILDALVRLLARIA